jgi:hypothetical protein
MGKLGSLALPKLGRTLGPREQSFALPYAIDFTALANGSLPSWVAPTWSISSAKATNTPTLMGEMLTDRGLETFTGGLADGWSLRGTPTPTQDTLAPRPGSLGTSDQKLAVTATSTGMYQTVTTVAGEWYLVSGWLKSDGTHIARLFVRDGSNPSSGTVLNQANVTSATWYYASCIVRAISTSMTILVGAASSASYNIYADDCSCQNINKSSMVAKLNHNYTGTAVVKAALRNGNGGTNYFTHIGIVGWWDGVNPLQNCLFGYIDYQDGTIDTLMVLGKFVGATWSPLISIAVPLVQGAYLEIRRTAPNTFQLWYNGSQVGTDQTVTNAEIINNKYSGLFSDYGGGNSCDAFFLS